MAELADALAETALIGLDTEFVRESTYYPQLCLIQVATPDLAACVDCVVDIDLTPLHDSLLRDSCTWIVHSARQDLEVIWQAAGRLPARLIDTQIAASLAGFAPQQGLQSLLAETLGVELGKHFTRTDWSRRPLPADALRYALDDVRHLIALWADLKQRLEALQRLPWLEQDCAALLAEHPEADAATVWGRLRGVRSMSLDDRCAALALVEWRERSARRMNRPRRWILSDAVLLDIARRRPEDSAALAAVPHMPRRLAARSGRQILTALQRRGDPAIRAAAGSDDDGERPDKNRLRALQASVQAHARELGIHTEVLATRRDIAALARGQRPDPQSGWRAKELARLLD